MNTAEQLFQQARHLPADQRLALAHRLLSDIEPEQNEEVFSAWEAEIRQRILRYDRGETRTRPADEVIDILNTRLQI